MKSNIYIQRIICEECGCDVAYIVNAGIIKVFPCFKCLSNMSKTK